MNNSWPSKSCPIGPSLKPKVLYTERVEYAKDARKNKTEGAVVLSVVYTGEKVLNTAQGLSALVMSVTQDLPPTPALRKGRMPKL